MHIISGFEILTKSFTASVVTIGNFDGVHRGHREVFRCLQQAGAIRGLPAVVVTFEPHPLKVLAPDSAPALITTYQQKLALIAAAGIEELMVIPFSSEFAGMTAEAFVTEILCGSLGMKHIVVGHDYAFGRGRTGTFSTLQRLGLEHGFTVEDLPALGAAECIYSSSLARSLISEGSMAAVSDVLGRYYSVSGTVGHGREIGQKLGYPTANLVAANELIPPDGVYAVMVLLDGLLFKGACAIGNNPTFPGLQRTIEVFLLDFTGRIYGREIVVAFVEKLRPMQAFADDAQLKDAISRDVDVTRTILKGITAHYLPAYPISGAS